MKCDGHYDGPVKSEIARLVRMSLTGIRANGPNPYRRRVRSANATCALNFIYRKLSNKVIDVAQLVRAGAVGSTRV
jgi:hypothetical protein